MGVGGCSRQFNSWLSQQSWLRRWEDQSGIGGHIAKKAVSAQKKGLSVILQLWCGLGHVETLSLCCWEHCYVITGQADFHFLRFSTPPFTYSSVHAHTHMNAC